MDATEKNNNLIRKKQLRKIKRQVKGITLIALVVTIIILLILAGIALNLTIEENGIFTRAQNAVDRYEAAAIEEKLKMLILADYIPDEGEGSDIIKGIYSMEETEENEKWDCIIELNGELYRVNMIITESDVSVESATKIDALDDMAIPMYIMFYLNGYTDEIEIVSQNDESIIIRYKNNNYIIIREYTQDSEKKYIKQYNGIIDMNPGELEGDGTEQSPYLIQSIEDLVAFSEMTEDEHDRRLYASLDTDLDFNSNDSYMNPYTTVFGDINGNTIIEPLKIELTTGMGFYSIGRYGFNGVFDGNNHSISNLYIDRTENKNQRVAAPIDSVGLFFKLQYDSEIRNLKVTGNINSTLKSVGGIVGKIDLHCIIDNCINEVNITARESSSVGGIVGASYSEGSNNITNCKNYGNISMIEQNEYNEDTAIGGIIGRTQLNNPNTDIVDIINNCINYGTITTISNGTDLYKGDICGKTNKTEQNINNCENKGTLEVETKSELNSFTTYIGGIAGARLYTPK